MIKKYLSQRSRKILNRCFLRGYSIVAKTFRGEVSPLPHQIVKICVTVSREKLKNRTYQVDSEKIIGTLSRLTEKEREEFLGPAAEFLFNTMKRYSCFNSS